MDSSHTMVTIATFNAKIEIGNGLIPLPSLHNGGWERDYGSKKVPPSTIEEYEILLKIGKTLGISSKMPKLILP